jgi:hypothetical protein
LRAQQTTKRKAINAPHFQVKNHQIALVIVKDAKSRRRIRHGYGPISCVFEHSAQVGPHQRVIVDDQECGIRLDFRWRSRHCSNFFQMRRRYSGWLWGGQGLEWEPKPATTD